MGKFLANIGSAFCAFQNFLLSCLVSSFWGNSFKSDDISCVLIHRVGKIGDMVCALPAIYAVRKRWPNSKLILLTNNDPNKSKSLQNFLLSLSWVDQVIFYTSSDLKNYKKLIEFTGALKRLNIDLWIALPQDLTSFFAEVRNLVFVKFIKAKTAFGFRVNTTKIFSFFQAKYLKFEYEVERLNKLVKFTGAIALSDYGLSSSSNNKRVVACPLKNLGDTKEAKILAIAPGGSREINRWPIERYKNIASRWINTGGIVLIIGGQEDRWMGDYLVKEFYGGASNLCGSLDILETCNLLESCNLLLTNDSGPVHFGAINRVPMVVVSSARDFPGKWAPKYSYCSVIRSDQGCSPCFLEKCKNKNVCLTTISVDDVWGIIEKNSRI